MVQFIPDPNHPRAVTVTCLEPVDKLVSEGDEARYSLALETCGDIDI